MNGAANAMAVSLLSVWHGQSRAGMNETSGMDAQLQESLIIPRIYELFLVLPSWLQNLLFFLSALRSSAQSWREQCPERAGQRIRVGCGHMSVTEWSMTRTDTYMPGRCSHGCCGRVCGSVCCTWG